MAIGKEEGESVKVLFLDTNVYLHCRSVEEIDWLQLIGADSVEIVVPRVTLHELDKQKNSHASSKLRERARSVLKKLEAWLANEDQEIRPGVKVRLHPDNVFRVRRKFILEVFDLMLRLNQCTQAVGQLWRKIVVKKELHAARLCSNLTALRTEAGLISNQRATSSTEPLAETLRARTDVGIPS